MLEGTDWTTVLVALATGGTAALGPVLLWIKQAQGERKSVRAALFAEVSALIELVERRHYLNDMKRYEAFLLPLTRRELDELNPDDFKYPITVGEHYNRVYQANVSRLGILSAVEARQIVRFYQLADSVRADVSPGGPLYSGTTNRQSYTEAIGILEDAIEIGTALTRPWSHRMKWVKGMLKK
ncbi:MULTISPECIES: hypothetical protein [Pseudomonas]|jgi:hypothetical protein|uniref:Uncharacterized protein n=1 Tax=Pseudomonas reactans TaxID=117680 RepID=A0A7Y8G3H5_9PSED|nr:hypothetical protein [Pseudomonas reactans]NWE90060.1 hypothetical protein [Pseudomonas reactans]